jgi:AmmeMemoRadiSam system protein B
MPGKVRESLIAGQWYPGTARELERMIEGYLSKAKLAEPGGEVVGLISPHAGYVYSGQTAAFAYKQVVGVQYDVVAVISPLHRMPLGRFASTTASAYETPLGLVRVDETLLEGLGRRVSLGRVDYDGEHAIEIQLPFLQVVLDGWTLLPVMIGAGSFDAAVELGTALADLLGDRKALIVASTDLHHVENYDQVVHRDQRVIDAIATFDMARIKDVLSPHDCSVCGRIPVYAMLTAAQALGADRVQVLHHTNSGDVTGNRSPGQYTVGYMAAAVYRAG